MTTPLRRRWPWLRPVLFLIFLASLPFTWSEEVHISCDGQQVAPSTYKSGLELLFTEPKATALIVVLVTIPLGLAWLAPRAKLWLRVVAHLTAAFVSANLFVIAHFSATFTFAKIRIHTAAYIGLGAIALGAIEALARAILEFVEWLRERRSTSSRL